MSDPTQIQKAQPPTVVNPEIAEIEKLPPEMKTMVSLMAGFFRSTTGPDPETAKMMAQTEMHEESCKLEAYGKSIDLRSQQSRLDHEFRRTKLNHDTSKSFVIMAVCVAFMVCGLYLLVAQNNTTVGTPLLVGGFALLGGKVSLGKDKD